MAPSQLALKGSGFFGLSQVSGYLLKRADSRCGARKPEGGLPGQLALLLGRTSLLPRRQVGKVGTWPIQADPLVTPSHLLHRNYPQATQLFWEEAGASG